MEIDLDKDEWIALSRIDRNMCMLDKERDAAMYELLDGKRKTVLENLCGESTPNHSNPPNHREPSWEIPSKQTPGNNQ